MGKIKVTKVRSDIKRPKDQKLTLRALGLRRIGQVVDGVNRGTLFSNKVYELQNGLLGLLNIEVKDSGDLYVSRKDNEWPTLAQYREIKRGC